MLNSEQIVATAQQRIGVEDRDPLQIRENLDALVDALNNDRSLPEKGEAFTLDTLVARTANRLEAQKWLLEHPEIGDEQITDPVFLTGLPRSGTTFFQYLFDRDHRFRLIRTWEAVEPFPPPGFDPVAAQRRKEKEAETQKQHKLEVEGFDAMHLLDLDGPQECHVFMEQGYAAIGYYNLYEVPSYFDYLRDDLDFTAAYQVHKRQLQLLQWRSPRPRWALKYPGHVLAMDSILDVFPGASFVMTHRDPVQTLASLCKLTAALRGARYETPVDPVTVGRQMFDLVQLHIDRIMAFASGPNASRVTHVDYYRLLDNPPLVMGEVHSSLGIDSPDTVKNAVDQWHRDNPKGARGSNPYALEQFGLDGDEVAERFAAYMAHFDIPRENEGLKRTAT